MFWFRKTPRGQECRAPSIDAQISFLLKHRYAFKIVVRQFVKLLLKAEKKVIFCILKPPVIVNVYYKSINYLNLTF